MTKAYDDLHSAASRARVIGQRVSGDGGVLDQIEGGQWDAELGEREATDLAAELRAVAERMRAGRAFAGGQAAGDFRGAWAVRAALDARLPMNRKERFFTGTVLPMIICGDGFEHLNRFLVLCGLPPGLVEGGLDGDQDLQFFTEYGFAESVVTDADRQRFGPPTPGDTPDLVLTGPDWLLAVEAKVYDRPDRVDLDTQLRRQRTIIDTWQQVLGLSPDRVRHVVLLPRELATDVGEFDQAATVTWQQVLEEYRGVGPAYWVAVLDEALARYPALVSRRAKVQFGVNAEDRMTGLDIVLGHTEGTLRYTHMGRLGGLTGPRLAADSRSGQWRQHVYEVRATPLDSPNWFRIEDFVGLVRNDAKNLPPD